MEVILKKCKITKSIFNQIVNVNIKYIDNYKPLGWVYINSNKWVLLYNNNDYDLKKIMYFFDVNIETSEIEDKFYVKFELFNGNISTSHMLSKEESEKTKDDLLKIKEISIQLGQIFI